MGLQWFLFCATVLCYPVFGFPKLSDHEEVNPCSSSDFKQCFLDQAVHTILNLTDLSREINETDGRRSSVSDVEEQLFSKLGSMINVDFDSDDVEVGRQLPIRTFNKAWKYLVPLLIGVVLKLAAFIPLILTVMTLIAKSALLSGNLAILFTAINIFIKYWYPKFSHGHRFGFENHNGGEFGHYGHNENYGHHFGYDAYGHQENHGDNTHKRYMVLG